MKKLILLLLFIPLVSFGQDFRKMSFGDTKEQLTQTYPNVDFTVEDYDGMEYVYHTDNVGGIGDTRIVYVFLNKEFKSGIYMFADGSFLKDGDERLKDYKSISNRLNDKYEMEDETEWHKTTWKSEPNSHGFAVNMGDVTFGEKYQNDRITIMHLLNKENGELGHMVMYASTPFYNMLQEESDNEF